MCAQFRRLKCYTTGNSIHTGYLSVFLLSLCRQQHARSKRELKANKQRSPSASNKRCPSVSLSSRFQSNTHQTIYQKNIKHQKISKASIASKASKNQPVSPTASSPLPFRQELISPIFEINSKRRSLGEVIFRHLYCAFTVHFCLKSSTVRFFQHITLQGSESYSIVYIYSPRVAPKKYRCFFASQNHFFKHSRGYSRGREHRSCVGMAKNRLKHERKASFFPRKSSQKFTVFVFCLSIGWTLSFGLFLSLDITQSLH